VAAPRLVAAVIACTVGLAFWWALTEPLRVPAFVLFAIPGAMLLAAGVIAGRIGFAAAPIALVFSLLLGSLIGTWMHRFFAPSSLPVSSFGDHISLDLEGLIGPMIVAVILGAIGGIAGERVLPTRREWPGR
jgi:hypothetical protein